MQITITVPQEPFLAEPSEGVSRKNRLYAALGMYRASELSIGAACELAGVNHTHHNFAGPANPDDCGMIFPNHTDDKKLTQLLRQMRRYNPIPNQATFGPGFRNLTLGKIVEDPNFRDSGHSYFIQATDLAAYLLYQHLTPNAYMKKKAGYNYFAKLDPILCKVVSSKDP